MNPGSRLLVLALPFVLIGCGERKGDGGAAVRTGTGRAAVARTRADPSGDPNRAAALAEKAGQFGGTDPVAGLAWARGLAGEDRITALQELASACATTDLQTALAAALDLPAGEARARLAAQLVGEWAMKEAPAALEWAKNLPEGDERDEIIAGWVTATAEAAPELSANTAAQDIRPGAIQNRAVVATVQRWMQSDFEGAKKWVDDFPEGVLRTDAEGVLGVVKSE